MIDAFDRADEISDSGSVPWIDIFDEMAERTISPRKTPMTRYTITTYNRTPEGPVICDSVAWELSIPHLAEGIIAGRQSRLRPGQFMHVDIDTPTGVRRKTFRFNS